MLYIFTIISVWDVLFVTVLILITVAYSTVAERKTMASMQRRIGPNKTGLYGIAQAFADAFKLIFKEFVLPSQANKILFFMSPIITLVCSLSNGAVIPFGPGLTILDFFLGMLYILTVSSMSTLGILLAGWSANSKYALLGCLRSTAQLISYELVLTSSVLIVILILGNFSLSVISECQKAVWTILPLLPSFVIFFTCCIAETNRPPFDLAEAESELVSGYMIEHAAVIFVYFFLGEYTSIVSICIVSVILFIGSYLISIKSMLFIIYDYKFILYDVMYYKILNFFGFFYKNIIILNHIYDSASSSFILSLKTNMLIFGFVLVRASYPRIRFDQLMSYCWIILLPITVAFILLIPCVLYGLETIPSNDILFRAMLTPILAKTKLNEKTKSDKETINDYNQKAIICIDNKKAIICIANKTITEKKNFIYRFFYVLSKFFKLIYNEIYVILFIFLYVYAFYISPELFKFYPLYLLYISVTSISSLIFILYLYYKNENKDKSTYSIFYKFFMAILIGYIVICIKVAIINYTDLLNYTDRFSLYLVMSPICFILYKFVQMILFQTGFKSPEKPVKKFFFCAILSIIILFVVIPMFSPFLSDLGKSCLHILLGLGFSAAVYAQPTSANVDSLDDLLADDTYNIFRYAHISDQLEVRREWFMKPFPFLKELYYPEEVIAYEQVKKKLYEFVKINNETHLMQYRTLCLDGVCRDDNIGDIPITDKLIEGLKLVSMGHVEPNKSHSAYINDILTTYMPIPLEKSYTFKVNLRGDLESKYNLLISKRKHYSMFIDPNPTLETLYFSCDTQNLYPQVKKLLTAFIMENRQHFTEEFKKIISHGIDKVHITKKLLNSIEDTADSYWVDLTTPISPLRFFNAWNNLEILYIQQRDLAEESIQATHVAAYVDWKIDSVQDSPVYPKDPSKMLLHKFRRSPDLRIPRLFNLVLTNDIFNTPQHEELRFILIRHILTNPLLLPTEFKTLTEKAVNKLAAVRVVTGYKNRVDQVRITPDFINSLKVSISKCINLDKYISDSRLTMHNELVNRFIKSKLDITYGAKGPSLNQLFPGYPDLTKKELDLYGFFKAHLARFVLDNKLSFHEEYEFLTRVPCFRFPMVYGPGSEYIGNIRISSGLLRGLRESIALNVNIPVYRHEIIKSLKVKFYTSDLDKEYYEGEGPEFMSLYNSNELSIYKSVKAHLYEHVKKNRERFPEQASLIASADRQNGVDKIIVTRDLINSLEELELK